MHREICVKQFSGTTASKFIKLGTNVRYYQLYCVSEYQHLHAYHSLYLCCFPFSPKYFVSYFASPMGARVLKFLYTSTEGCEKRKQDTEI